MLSSSVAFVLTVDCVLPFVLSMAFREGDDETELESFLGAVGYIIQDSRRWLRAWRDIPPHIVDHDIVLQLKTEIEDLLSDARDVQRDIVCLMTHVDIDPSDSVSIEDAYADLQDRIESIDWRCVSAGVLFP